MTDRRPGWYWLKDKTGRWEPAEWVPGHYGRNRWWYRCGWYNDDAALGVAEIGPRAASPDERENEHDH